MEREIKVVANMSDRDREARVAATAPRSLSQPDTRTLVGGSFWETVITMNESDVRKLHEELGKLVAYWDSPAEFGKK